MVGVHWPHGQLRWIREIPRRWEQREAVSCVFLGMERDDREGVGALRCPGPVRAHSDAGDARAAVGALYAASALGLIRLAFIMLGDLPGAEDVVQEAFCGLYRRWDRLRDADSAMVYVRASVLNGCRSARRRRAVRRQVLADQPPEVSAEAMALSREEREDVVRAIGRLPRRQREAVVLRFYCDLADEQIALVMGIGQSTVRSTVHRAIETLGRSLKETS